MSKSNTTQKEDPAAGKAPAAGIPDAGGTPKMGGTPDNQGSTSPLAPKIIEPSATETKVGDQNPGNPDDKRTATTIVEKVVEKVIEKPVPVFDITEDITIVICGTTEALPLLTKAWEQKAGPAVIIPHDVSSTPFSELITGLLAEENIPGTFVLVPENCFPTTRVNIADLTAYRIRKVLADPKTNKWEKTSNTNLPVLLEATAVLKTLELLNDDADFTAAEFFEKYNGIAHAGEMPEEIGMSFGNIVAYADQPTPCMAKVAEALVRKKFICTTAEGFTPIKERLALLYDGK